MRCVRINLSVGNGRERDDDCSDRDDGGVGATVRAE